MLTVCNELGQVLGQWFTHITSLLEVKGALRKLAARYTDGDGLEVLAMAFVSSLIGLLCLP